jgi:hypothetical protein
MIDPFTAFAMAQGAVKGIKSAMQLGKDINGLYNDFSQFFQAADAVHIASTKMRMNSIGKSDAQLGAEALKIAMASKALRDSEKELKEMLIWSGNAPVWEQMQAERVRMIKERAAVEQAARNRKQKDMEVLADMLLNILLGVGVFAATIPLILIAWQVAVVR